MADGATTAPLSAGCGGWSGPGAGRRLKSVGPGGALPWRPRLSSDGTAGAATWQDPVWRAAALEWAGERLAERGLALDGEPQQPHVRPWSTAFRLPVRGGAVRLESVVPGSAQEPVFVSALGRWAPEHVLVPLAVDRDQRLMLLPDSGATLRDSGSLAALRETCAVALRVAPLPRAMTWRRILRGVQPSDRTEWADAVPRWTAEYLEPDILAAPGAAPAGHPGN